MRNLRTAFGLLTTLPFGLPEDWRSGDSGRAAVWYPLVGLVIGLITWLCWRLSMSFFPPTIAGILTLLVWIVLSGGLHLDGLADCCDGLFASASVERRLEIMKDPRLGTFGGVGLVLILLFKASALSSLSASAAPGILLAAVLSRWCILPAGLLPLARSGGMGADFSAGLRPLAIWFGALLPLALVFLLGWTAAAASVAALLLLGVVLWLAKTRIKGVTGDVFGMLVEGIETIILVVFTIGVR